MNASDLQTIWNELKTDAKNTTNPLSMVYKALGKTAKGIRACYRPEEDQIELLVEVPADWQKYTGALPNWYGIVIRVLSIEVKSGLTQHLCLTLQDNNSDDIFSHFICDLVHELEGIADGEIRAQILKECLARWNHFFMKAGHSGLSIQAQMGLFSELCCLEILVNSGLSPDKAPVSWKGPERGYHDFDLNGLIIEVKSTSSKEPRKVWINNERQLDIRGTKSLHLFVITLAQTDGGGETLTEKVDAIRNLFMGSSNGLFEYDNRLVQAGFLRRHRENYQRNFTVIKKELFLVGSDTPRLTDLPDGVGDIRYTVLLAACRDSAEDISLAINSIVKAYNDS